jgi:hypothetical protein
MTCAPSFGVAKTWGKALVKSSLSGFAMIT